VRLPKARRMMTRRTGMLAVLFLATLLVSCAHQPAVGEPALTGAWRSTVQFKSGPFAVVKDLEFMYVFNAGGTLTESSNYDGAPPVPPAYGAWRRVGPREYEARYEYYATAPPASFEALATGSGWLPAGRGVLPGRITPGAGRGAFTSTIHYDDFDGAGKSAPGSGDAEGRGVRIGFAK